MTNELWATPTFQFEEWQEVYDGVHSVFICYSQGAFREKDMGLKVRAVHDTLR